MDPDDIGIALAFGSVLGGCLAIVAMGGNLRLLAAVSAAAGFLALIGAIAIA